MKKFLSFCMIAAILAVMALPIFAETISFKTTSEEEAPYIYFEMGSSLSGTSRFHDGTGLIIYEFPCPEGSKYAALTWKIQAQYQVSVTNTDPDDDEAFEVIDENVPTQEEIDSGKADWGYSNGVQIPTYDLSKFCEGNTTGKIWVKMADADITNGWGGFIFSDYAITYYVGAEPPAPVEKPKTTAEIQAESVAKIVAGEQSFVTYTDTETPYIYDTQGTGNADGSRFHDAAAYTIYQFTVKPGDTYAGIEWVLNNQYLIEINTTDPTDEGAWKVFAEAEQTAEEIEEGAPDWGNRFFALTPELDEEDENFESTLYIYRHDLSQYIQGNTTGKVWIRMGDAAPDAGWGGYISVRYPVTFKSGTSPITWAPSGFPLTGTDFIEVASAETPAETPAGTPAETPTDSGSAGTASSPSTFDAISVVALVAFAALGSAVIVKKRH